MLAINPEDVCFIISKAQQFHSKEEVVIPEQADSPADDWALQVLADHEGDSTVEEVRAVIADLEPDQQASLVALMWLGRGDYDMDSWHEALTEAASQANDRTADYLLATPLVADYLIEGLAIHGHVCDE